MAKKNMGSIYGGASVTSDKLMEMLVKTMISGRRTSMIIEGAPGIGKTHIIQEASRIAYELFFKEQGYELVEPWRRDSKVSTIGDKQIGTLRLNVPCSDSSTFMGLLIPDIKKKTLTTCSYGKLPQGDIDARGILFLDEYGRGKGLDAQVVRSTVMDILDGGQSHTFKLPPGMLTVVATNPDNGLHSDVEGISPASLNRAIVLYLTPNVPSFVNWASRKPANSLMTNINPIVLSFVQNEGLSCLYDREALEKGLIYATPRAWHRVSTIYTVTEWVNQILQGTMDVPTAEQIDATFPENHVDSQMLHNWLTAGKDNDKLFIGSTSIRDSFEVIHGLVGELYAAKFIEFAVNNSKVVTAEQVLFNFSSVKKRLVSEAKANPDLVNNLGFIVINTLWELGIDDPKMPIAMQNFAKFIGGKPSLLNEDTRMHLLRKLTHFFRTSTTEKNWTNSELVRKWIMAFDKHDELIEMFSKISETDRQLAKAIKERKRDA